MNGLRITLFVIALVTLASQTFRHAYVRWLEPRTSVLDKYGTQTEQQILAAKSLQELVALYDAARTKMKDYEKAHPGVSGEPSFQPSSEYVKLTRDEESLKNAINEWEQKSKDVHELWHFWIAGMVAFLIASFASLRGDRWVVIALLILGLGLLRRCGATDGWGSRCSSWPSRKWFTPLARRFVRWGRSPKWTTFSF